MERRALNQASSLDEQAFGPDVPEHASQRSGNVVGNMLPSEPLMLQYEVMSPLERFSTFG